MATRFKNHPAEPANEGARNAYVILCNTHDASSSFLDIFENTRRTRSAVGTPTDEEQDLLRAMFTFASAGLDSMTKQLVRDALAQVIDSSPGAMGNFKTFIAKRLSRREAMDPQFLAEVLASRDPRGVLVDELVDELVSQSLQSKETLLRAASYFDIPSTDLTPNLGYLEEIFKARNQIAHEMDVDFDQPNRNRRPRRRKQMIDYTNELLRIANVLLARIDLILGQQANG